MCQKKNRECCAILRFSNLSKFLITFPETAYAPNVCVGHFIAHNIALSAYLLPLTWLIYIFSTLLICMESPHFPSQACHRDQTEFRAVKANSLFGIQMFASLLLQMPGWQAHTVCHLGQGTFHSDWIKTGNGIRKINVFVLLPTGHYNLANTSQQTKNDIYSFSFQGWSK